MPMILDWWN